MSTDTVEEHRAASRVDQPTTSAAALTAMGIVYGDLGTSPLYTLQAVAQTFDGGLSPSAALGSLSLIFWLLIITVSIKYCLFVMRADNHGEGGILALMLLTRASWYGRGRALVIMGLFGAALIYGDGIITPAISVLSALEGLNQATEIFKPHVMPMAVAVLLALFAEPRYRAHRQGIRAGHARLVRDHRGAWRRRHRASARRSCRRQSGPRARIPAGEPAHRSPGARGRVPGDHRR